MHFVYVSRHHRVCPQSTYRHHRSRCPCTEKGWCGKEDDSKQQKAKPASPSCTPLLAFPPVLYSPKSAGPNPREGDRHFPDGERAEADNYAPLPPRQGAGAHRPRQRRRRRWDVPPPRPPRNLPFPSAVLRLMFRATCCGARGALLDVLARWSCGLVGAALWIVCCLIYCSVPVQIGWNWEGSEVYFASDFGLHSLRLLLYVRFGLRRCILGCDCTFVGELTLLDDSSVVVKQSDSHRVFRLLLISALLYYLPSWKPLCVEILFELSAVLAVPVYSNVILIIKGWKRGKGWKQYLLYENDCWSGRNLLGCIINLLIVDHNTMSTDT